MSQRRQAPARVLLLVAEGRCTTADAAELLGLSPRHVRRLRGFREQGPAALAHGNRGRPPAHALPPALRAEVVRLAETVYRGYNHTHLHELLAEEHGLRLSRRSLARILTAAGHRSPRRRRPRKYRIRRERVPQAGMLLQVDGSQHDWLEGRGPRLVLLGAVDDATGDVPSHAPRRNSHPAVTPVRAPVAAAGVPRTESQAN